MLRLRPFRAPDAKTIIRWTSAPEKFYKWTAGIMGDYPVSEKRLLEAVSGREDNPRYFPLVAFDESGPVGFFTVRTPGEDDRKVRFGYVIVDPSKRGRGYGKQMLTLGLKFAFELYGANEVSLGVFENNRQAFNCYRSVGFRETGVLEAYDLCGETWTDIDMVIRKIDMNSNDPTEVQYGRTADITSWMELVKEVKWNFPGLETEEAVKEHENTVLKFMSQDRALCVKDQNQVVGVLLFSRKHNMICCLAVKPEYRKRGIASAMMKKALSELDSERDITVSTFREGDEKGTAPRALYRKFGFTPGKLTEEFGYPNQVFILHR